MGKKRKDGNSPTNEVKTQDPTKVERKDVPTRRLNRNVNAAEKRITHLEKHAQLLELCVTNAIETDTTVPNASASLLLQMTKTWTVHSLEH